MKLNVSELGTFLGNGVSGRDWGISFVSGLARHSAETMGEGGERRVYIHLEIKLPGRPLQEDCVMCLVTVSRLGGDSFSSSSSSTAGSAAILSPRENSRPTF